MPCAAGRRGRVGSAGRAGRAPSSPRSAGCSSPRGARYSCANSRASSVRPSRTSSIRRCCCRWNASWCFSSRICARARRRAAQRRGGPARLSSPSRLAQAHVVILPRNPCLESSPLTGPHGHAGRARAAAEQQRPPGRCSLGRQLLVGRRGAAELRPGGAVGTCKAGMLGWRAGQASSVGCVQEPDARAVRRPDTVRAPGLPGGPWARTARLGVQVIHALDRLLHVAALHGAPDLHPVRDGVQVDARRRARLRLEGVRRLYVALPRRPPAPVSLTALAAPTQHQRLLAMRAPRAPRPARAAASPRNQPLRTQPALALWKSALPALLSVPVATGTVGSNSPPSAKAGNGAWRALCAGSAYP